MQDQIENESKPKVEPKFTTLDDIDDLRKNVGFHFTALQNLESILKNGLVPQIGDNSSGTLGQSAIPKTYVSYGLEGVMQLYNRLLNLSLEGRIRDFQSTSHKPFLPNNVQGKDLDSNLSLLEGFEFIRLYMENNTYLVFDAPMTEYDHLIGDSQLEEINEKIKKFTDENGQNLYEKFKELNKKIEQLSSDKDANQEELRKCIVERNKITTDVYRETIKIVRAKQGKILNPDESFLIDKVDFNDEKLRWTNFEENPHNTHVRIVEDENGNLVGAPISSQAIHQFSSDGKTGGNGLQFLEKMLTLVKDSDRLNIQSTRCVDVDLLKQFHEYVKLVEKYKRENPDLMVKKPIRTVITKDGRTVSYPATITIDLDNISMYPGLEKFGEDVSKEYQEGREKADELREKLKLEKKISMNRVVENATRNGITPADIESARNAENSQEITKEGEAKGD